MKPLPYLPPSEVMVTMRSIISIGGGRKLGVAVTEHLAPRAGEQGLGVIGRKVLEIGRHRRILILKNALDFTPEP